MLVKAIGDSEKGYQWNVKLSDFGQATTIKPRKTAKQKNVQVFEENSIQPSAVSSCLCFCMARGHTEESFLDDVDLHQ